MQHDLTDRMGRRLRPHSRLTGVNPFERGAHRWPVPRVAVVARCSCSTIRSISRTDGANHSADGSHGFQALALRQRRRASAIGISPSRCRTGRSGSSGGVNGALSSGPRPRAERTGHEDLRKLRAPHTGAASGCLAKIFQFGAVDGCAFHVSHHLSSKCRKTSSRGAGKPRCAPGLCLNLFAARNLRLPAGREGPIVLSPALVSHSQERACPLSQVRRAAYRCRRFRLSQHEPNTFLPDAHVPRLFPHAC